MHTISNYRKGKYNLSLFCVLSVALGREISQAASSRFLKAVAPSIIPVEFVANEVTPGQVSPRILQSVSLHHCSLFTQISLGKRTMTCLQPNFTQTKFHPIVTIKMTVVLQLLV